MIHKRSTALERSVKHFLLKGLNYISFTALTSSLVDILTLCFFFHRYMYLKTFHDLLLFVKDILSDVTICFCRHRHFNRHPHALFLFVTYISLGLLLCFFLPQTFHKIFLSKISQQTFSRFASFYHK